jgi:hypothetical protein
VARISLSDDDSPPLILLKLSKSNLNLLAVFRAQCVHTIIEFLEKATIRIEQQKAIALQSTQEHFRLISIARAGKVASVKRLRLNNSRHQHGKYESRCAASRHSLRRAASALSQSSSFFDNSVCLSWVTVLICQSFQLLEQLNALFADGC